MILKPVTKQVGDAVDGYYVGLPSNYDSVKNIYPALVYIPGAGQLGNGSIDLPLLLKDGPVELLDEKKFPSIFHVNGKTFTMIVFSPQLKWYPGTNSIKACIDFLKQNYRVDSTRIYLSGLSMGGILSCDVAGEVPKSLAAIIPMSGVSRDFASTNTCKMIAEANLPVWAFQSNDDPVFSAAETKSFVAKINSYGPMSQAKLTLWPDGGHDSWTRALDPGYKEQGMNIYEWMLQFHR